MEKEKKPVRFEVVAQYLKSCFEFTTVKTMSEDLGMTELAIRASIPMARRELAMQGIPIVNSLGLGYKVGTIDEFHVEIDKSCKRALADLISMYKYIKLIEKNENFKGKFKSGKDIVSKNIYEIRVLFDAPELDDYDDYEDFSRAMGKFIEYDKLVPDKVRTIPLEEV